MKRQKLLKVAGGALAAAMSLAMLAGCSGNTTSGSSSTGETGTASESSTAGETTGTEKNKLAFFLPMTGDQMQYGESLSRGAELPSSSITRRTAPTTSSRSWTTRATRRKPSTLPT